jgi:hypothetical protein
MDARLAALEQQTSAGPHGGLPSVQAYTHWPPAQVVPAEQHWEPQGGRWSGQLQTLLGPPLQTPPCGQQVAFGPHPLPDPPGIQMNSSGQQTWPSRPEQQFVDCAPARAGTEEPSMAAAKPAPSCRSTVRRERPVAMLRARSSSHRSFISLSSTVPGMQES